MEQRLSIASLLFVATNLHWIPGGGQAQLD